MKSGIVECDNRGCNASMVTIRDDGKIEVVCPDTILNEHDEEEDTVRVLVYDPEEVDPHDEIEPWLICPQCGSGPMNMQIDEDTAT